MSGEMEDMSDWDLSQKTETTWSSQVSTKPKGRRTYSRRAYGRSSSALSQQEQSRDVSDTSENEQRNSDWEVDFNPTMKEVVPPPIPNRRRFGRANSVTMHDRKPPPRQLTRSQSVSISGSSSSSSGSRRVNENINPNFEALEENFTPKRSKPVLDLRGRKKVRSELSIPKVPLSDSFSNLAKFGEDGWGQASNTNATFGTRPTASNELYFSEFIDSSPATINAGSHKKRNICESPLDDFLSPPNTQLSVNSFYTGESMDGRFSLGSSESINQRETEIQTDDGESLNDTRDDDSGDDASMESLGETPVPFTSNANAIKRRSSSFFGEELLPIGDVLEPGKADANDVIESMPSYQDLRFLVRSLRKEKAGSRLSWHVAPPVSWNASRRASFFNWTTQSLGFSFRAGGMAIAYLQISKTKGAGILTLLESAQALWKARGLGEKTPHETSQKPKFVFSNSKLTASVTKALSWTPKEPSSRHHQTSFVPPFASNNVDDDLMQGMTKLTMDEKPTPPKEEYPTSSITLEDSDDVSIQDCSRPSIENHSNARDLMAHMHGMTPVPRRGRPPRLSIQSMGSISTTTTKRNYNAASPYPQAPMSSIGGKSMVQDFVETPMMKAPDQRWGSRPVEGRDWGSSEQCDPLILEELSRRFEHTTIDAGLLDNMCSQTPLQQSQNFLDMELEAASSYSEPAESPTSFSESPQNDDLFDVPESLTQESHNDQMYSPFGQGLDSSGFNRARAMRRRQTSFAKHTRMSLIASVVNPTGPLLQGRKSLFIRPTQTGLRRKTTNLLETLVAEPEFVPTTTNSIEELSCSLQHVFNDEGLLESIFGFLPEHELLCVASLVSSRWADAATQAHANMMLMSVGCLGNSESDESDDEDSIIDTSLAIPGLMERQWSDLVSTFPWACFLSEGAFKRVYKVFNGNHRIEEAVSVMDVDMIESTGNMSVVGAELAVSVLLSSLVRRGVCPNFVVTRGVFSCPYEPPSRYWGSSENKRPKGAVYSSPKVKRLPKEPREENRGRFQYIRMELCDEGDTEEFLKRQPDESLSYTDATKLLFQIAFALHAAADRFSLKHYDVKLLNVFLQRIKSEKSGDVVMKYGLGEHTFVLRSPRGTGLVAKLADYGTANVDSGSCGQPVTIGQFTTLENTPIDYLIFGDDAYQGHGHDCFGLGLCMLHLFTGHAPYEEILEEVKCPENLKKELVSIWENEEESDYSVIRSLILSDVFKDEEGHIIEGEPDETLYDTLYRFIVLFGIPDLPKSFSGSKVWAALKKTLTGTSAKGKGSKRTYGSKKNQRNDVYKYNRDRRKYSLLRGNNKYISRARDALESLDGGMDLLLSLVSLDPQNRATALDVLNSSLMTSLRENDSNMLYSDEDEVFCYNSFSTQT